MHASSAALDFDGAQEGFDATLEHLLDPARPALVAALLRHHAYTIAVHQARHLPRWQEDVVGHALDAHKAEAGAVGQDSAFKHLRIECCFGMGPVRTTAPELRRATARRPRRLGDAFFHPLMVHLAAAAGRAAGFSVPAGCPAHVPRRSCPATWGGTATKANHPQVAQIR